MTITNERPNCIFCGKHKALSKEMNVCQNCLKNGTVPNTVRNAIHELEYIEKATDTKINQVEEEAGRIEREFK